MMAGVITTQRLTWRLEEIGLSLAHSDHALALIGLGSVGIETERLDEFSDLDFFTIVEPGAKQGYLQDLDWLEAVCPVAFKFRNTTDGYKLLYEDGIFCEFAVFEPSDLPGIPFTAGRIIWKQPEVADSIALPQMQSAPVEKSIEWLVGEALTNLYVGLCRYRRGEKLSAARFIQQYAVDRVLELVELVEKEQVAARDRFSAERRFEQRFPELARRLPEFVPGYERSPESASAILNFLEGSFAVNPAIAAAIRGLINREG
jgi:lincosamide nucleotidyltransferase B/F